MEEIGVVGLEKETSVSEKDIEKRKKQIINFFKKSKNWIYYAILSVILFISVFIRTRNLPRLKDITTGTWTLGPDLDPFLFLRWAKYIAEHGKLFLLDPMRYAPLIHVCSGVTCGSINTNGEMKLLSYMMAYLYKFLAVFDHNITVTYASILFPVVMAVLTGIAFFLFTRKLFYREDKRVANIIALVSTLFFVLMPSLLSRTIAGIPEKESAAFFFIFMAFYLFLEAYTSEKLRKGIICSFLAGIMTGILGLLWGGILFVFVAMAAVILFAFLIGKINGKRFLFYSLWLVGALIIMMPFSTRYTFDILLTSSSTALAFMVFFILGVDFLIFKKKIFNLDKKIKIKLPTPVLSLIISIIGLVVISSAVFGISFIPNIVTDIYQTAIHPFTPGRFEATVAENKQPYFINDWQNEFGPMVLNIPLYFWLFFIGSVFLFNYLIKSFGKKERRILTFSYLVFLFCLVFSKYSSGSVLNGDSNLSLFVYFGGALFLGGCLAYFYYRKYKEEKFSVFEEFNFAYLFYFVILTIMIVAARGVIRLIMVLAAVSPIAVGFLVVKGSQKFFEEKEETKKFFVGIVMLLILIASVFTVWAYYQNDKSMAEGFGPYGSAYSMQWQKAMAWVRDNTPTDAIFGHWWDYGYWLQSIGERATILDGGNAIGYWNHMMGRYVLTGTDEKTMLDFLYAHNGTDLLIDSTDIGKYAAFSSIGSDANYDRYSWIPNVLMDDSQTKETSNQTSYIYPIGTPLDQDVVYKDGGNDVLLPGGKAVVAAIEMVKNSKGEILQPNIYFSYNQQLYKEPLRTIYASGKLYDFGSGFDAGLFTFPAVSVNSDNKLQVNDIGAALYLSQRTVHSNLARLYLFGENSDYFKVAHIEDSLVVQQIKSQGLNVGKFIYYQGFQGPIEIWSINYPSGMKVDQRYLSFDYPAELQTAMPGTY